MTMLALVLMSKEKMEELGLKPLAKMFLMQMLLTNQNGLPPLLPKALPIALKKAGLEVSDIDFFEFNGAFQ